MNFKTIIYRLHLLALLILPFLFLFKIFLNSDTLFLDSIFRDFFEFKGRWYDWKMASKTLDFFIKIFFICLFILYGGGISKNNESFEQIQV